MITGLSLAAIWVLDQDSAKEFFTERLGLMVPGPPSLDSESAEQLKALITKGVLGAGAFSTDDCHAAYLTQPFAQLDPS